MGRYDKIKVYNGTEFVTPNRIRVYDGEVWQDLGTADSDFKKSMYVRYEDTNHRVTLNKNVTEVAGYSYKNGTFSATPAAGYCFCPSSSYGGGTFNFEAYIKRGTTGELTMLNLYTTNNSNNYFRVILNADNTVTVKTSCAYTSPYLVTRTTTAKINADDWNYIKVYSASGSKGITVTVNDSVITFSNVIRSYQSTKARNTIGANGLYIRQDGFNLRSVDYYVNSSSYSTVPVNNTETNTEINWI